MTSSTTHYAPTPFAPTAVALGLRAAGADRQRVIAELQRHFVDGRLGQEELAERVEAALAARTFGELHALLRDLPRAEPARPRMPAAADKGFGAHLASYVLVMGLLVAVWLVTTPGGYFRPIWPLLGWGIGVACHGLGHHGFACAAPSTSQPARH